jgi:hypothetical protein
MSHDVRRRLGILETRGHVGAPKFRVWVNKGDGLLRNCTGKVMTQDAFDTAFPSAIKIKLNIFEKSDQD